MGVYEVADVDSSKRYTLPETQVVKVEPKFTCLRLSSGDRPQQPRGEQEVHEGRACLRRLSRYAIPVLRIFPKSCTDTSTFYPAVLVVVSRRGGLYDYTATVQFEGDADENGITPLRIVPLRYIMRAQKD